MSRWEKLLERISALPNDVRFSELQKILEAYGYIMYAPGSGSSHYTFRKEGRNPITIPKQKPIKRVYVLMVKEVIEEENKNENA